MTDVYMWIVHHTSGQPPQFFAATKNEPPASMLEFITDEAIVVEIGPNDVQQIALVWADAQEIDKENT